MPLNRLLYALADCQEQSLKTQTQTLVKATIDDIGLLQGSKPTA